MTLLSCGLLLMFLLWEIDILYLNGIKPSCVFPIFKYLSASREMIMSSKGFPDTDQEYNLIEQAMTSELNSFLSASGGEIF